jgi:hypothetical protein
MGVPRRQVRADHRRVGRSHLQGPPATVDQHGGRVAETRDCLGELVRPDGSAGQGGAGLHGLALDEVGGVAGDEVPHQRHAQLEALGHRLAAVTLLPQQPGRGGRAQHKPDQQRQRRGSPIAERTASRPHTPPIGTGPES